MKEVAVNRKVGTRFGISHSRRSTRESASVQFRRQMVWICKGCKAPRSDGLMPWKTLIVLALLVGGFMWFADASTKRRVAKGVDSVISAADPHVNPLTRGREAATALVTTSDRDEDREVGGDAATAAKGESAAPRAADMDWRMPSIDEARIKALDGGKAARWKAEGMKGQVVPSDATVTDGTECRNVYATMKADGETATSATTTWCRSEAGEWTAR